MKPLSPPSSPPPSLVTSTSVMESPSSCSSPPSPPPPPPPPLPHFSLQSPELQAEFLRERLKKFQFNSESSVVSSVGSPASPASPASPYSFSPSSLSPTSSTSPTSTLPSPFTPTPSSSPRSPSSPSPSSPSEDRRPVRLSLSSPELLLELKESRTRPLRHVPAHNGLTTVFSGRGRRLASGPASSTRLANQRTSP